MSTIVTTSTRTPFGTPKRSVTLNGGDGQPIKLRDLVEFFTVAQEYMGFTADKTVEVHVDTSSMRDGQALAVTLGVQS